MDNCFFFDGGTGCHHSSSERGTATIHFFSWPFAQSQGVVLLIGFIAGFIASMLIYLPTHIRNKLKIRHHERRETDLEKQLNTERDKRE